MKLLLLNPNTTAALTDRMAAVAATVADAATELVPVTASRGVPFISSRAEAQIAGTLVLETLAEHHDRIDGAVIAGFGDPGLVAARELFDRPVVGMAEAAMLTACLMGDRFAVVSFARTFVPLFQDLVALYRLEGRLAGIRVPDAALPARDVGPQTGGDGEDGLEDGLAALALRAVDEDHADVIILGGAPLAGLAFRIADRVPVPIVDPICAAVRQVETLVRLGGGKARAGRYARPAPKRATGLGAALARRIAHDGS